MPVYIGIIETIGERLYTGKITWLREYIQNAIDAKASAIEIHIKAGNLVIKDKGNGMDDSELVDEAFSLGRSTKGPDEIGELGIGMFAGVGISDRVTVLTKMAGKPAYLATFDVLAYKQLKADNPETLFDDAIGQVFKVVQSESKEFKSDEQFTEITFENLEVRSKQLLEADNVAKFIRTTVNLPIAEKFPWKKEIEAFLGKDQKQVEVTLITSDKSINLNKFEDIKEEFNKPITLTVKDGSSNQIGKLWACYAKLGTVPKSPGAHLLVKFKGMTVGDDSAVRSRFRSKDSRRFLGEFVVSRVQGLTINTERTWFSDSDQLSVLENQGKEVLQQLYGIADLDSRIGNGLIRKQEKAKGLTAKIETKIEERDFGTAGRLRDQQDRLLATIKAKEIERASELGEIKKEADGNKSPIIKATFDILSNQELKEVTPATTKSLPPEEKKRNNEQSIMTLLGHYIIDSRITEVASGKNMKDTTENVFTLIETEMKHKIGETRFMTFPTLMTRFKARCKDVNEPTNPTEKANHNQSFDGLMNSTHFLLRNPAAHTFMKEMDNPRSICQVLLLGDFVLKWLDSWQSTSPPGGTSASP